MNELHFEYAVRVSRGILRQFEIRRELNQPLSKLEVEKEVAGQLRIEGVKPELIPAATQMIVDSYLKK